MNQTIKICTKEYAKKAHNLVKDVFTEWSNAEEGNLVYELIQEIREHSYYIPELELIMTDENDDVIGYAMFSRFHLEGRYEDKLLLLSPVAVKTTLQRQHISKRLIEYGFKKAKELGFQVVLVEGNPQNYRSRGFITSADYGIYACEKIELPAPECLMVKELFPGALSHIKGYVSYDCYKCLR